MDFKPVVIEDANEVRQAFFAGRCDVFTTDASALASVRATKAQNATDYVILPEIISKEPLAPVVRHGDDEWADIVRWVIFALIDAEENGITSKNVAEMAKSDNPGIKRLLGATPGMGKNLGLDEQWAFRAIQQVGNYGEIFERNLGKSSALKLDRGLNNLWTKGGLMYSWPFR
jgi:general L-amino acid transport system substrate-binding protein